MNIRLGDQKSLGWNRIRAGTRTQALWCRTQSSFPCPTFPLLTMLFLLEIRSPWSLPPLASLWQCSGGAEFLLSSHFFPAREGPKLYPGQPSSSYAWVSSINHLTQSSQQVLCTSLGHFQSSPPHWCCFHLWRALMVKKFLLVRSSGLTSWGLSRYVWLYLTQAALSESVSFYIIRQQATPESFLLQARQYTIS